MGKLIHSIGVIALVVAISACLSSCGGGDDAVRPDTKDNILVVPAGEYSIYVAAWVCATTDTAWALAPATACTNTSTRSENEVFPCPVTVEDDLVSFKCTERVDNGGGCIINVEYEFNGIQTGDLWVLTGTIRETSTFSGCTPTAPCTELDVIIIRDGPPQDC